MEKSYFDRTHRFGGIGVIIGIVIMLGIPAIVSTVYDMWPENIGAIFALGVLLLAPLQPLLTDPRIQTATPYMIPALFGSLMLGMLNNSCGTYVAKRKLTCMILPVLLVAGVNLVYPLAPLIGYVMIACMGLTVGCAWVLYKLGVIQMIPKTAKKTEEKA